MAASFRPVVWVCCVVRAVVVDAVEGVEGRESGSCLVPDFWELAYVLLPSRIILLSAS